ncbi:MAG: transposase [Spirochaetes bacterium]|nr:transposase [Spirochaetota bacterium]
MGRPRRIIQTGLSYHTYTRCRNLENHFKNDRFKNLVIKAILEIQKKLNFELNDFIIMPNHLHLVITTLNDKDTISKIMQVIKSVIAKRMNKLLGVRGPFWNERFGSKIVYFFPALCSYIANNPVRKGLIEKAEESKYGTYHVYRQENSKCKLKITFHKQFLTLGKSLAECFERQMYLDMFYIR